MIGGTKFGRCLAILGGPASTDNAAKQIEGADLLVHPASSSAEDTSCSHAGTAGTAAKQAGAKHLCITGVCFDLDTSDLKDLYQLKSSVSLYKSDKSGTQDMKYKACFHSLIISMSGKGVVQQARTHHYQLDCSAELPRHVIASFIFQASDNLPTGLLSASGSDIFPTPVDIPDKIFYFALQLDANGMRMPVTSSFTEVPRNVGSVCRLSGSIGKSQSLPFS